jgi:hypothetical protein
VAANADASRGVRRVEFYLDGYYLDSDSREPFEKTLTIPNTIARGYHTLKTVAYDDIGNTGSASVGIKINSEAASDDFLIIDPVNGQTIGRTQDIYSLAFSLQNPGDFNSILVYVEEIGGTDRSLIGSLSSPTSPIFTIPWTLPTSGQWVIAARAESSSGSLETPGILVQITTPETTETQTTTSGDLNPFE